MANKERFSLIEIFGKLPVSPDDFKKLDPKLKWLGICEEAPNHHYCHQCGSITPDIPYSHHTECSAYSKDESYPESQPSILGLCPKCKEDDLGIDSNSSLMVSVIDCGNCGFHYEGNCDEESLVRRFAKKFKKLIS